VVTDSVALVLFSRGQEDMKRSVEMQSQPKVEYCEVGVLAVPF